MVNQTARTKDEAEETVLGIQLLNRIEKTCNHIVSAGSLSTTEDDTDIHLCGISNVALLELDERHSVSVGEESLDFFLVIHALCWSTFFYLYCTLKSLRQFWLISSPCQLQCTFFHNPVKMFIEIYCCISLLLKNQVQKYAFSWRFGKVFE